MTAEKAVPTVTTSVCQAVSRRGRPCQQPAKWLYTAYDESGLSAPASFAMCAKCCYDVTSYYSGPYSLRLLSAVVHG